MNVVSSIFRKNRKPHRCDGCCTLIGVGEKMQNNNTADGGVIFTSRLCETCCDLIYKYRVIDDDPEFFPGEIHEMAQGNGYKNVKEWLNDYNIDR